MTNKDIIQRRKSEIHKQSIIKRMQPSKIRSIFRKIRLFFSPEQKQEKVLSVPQAIFLIRDKMLDGIEEQLVYNHKMLYLMLGYKVLTETLTEKIPDEYIGILIVRDGEKRGYQEYLKIQTKHVEKKSLVSQRIDLKDLSIASFDCRNMNFPQADILNFSKATKVANFPERNTLGFESPAGTNNK